jgi:hypothetical protein
MSLTFDQLKKRVGKNIKYYDNTTGWLTGRDVTETDIGEFINEIYTEEIFALFATQYPQDFRQVAYANSHIATGTVDTTSTSTTLVSTTSIFTNGMVGLTVYNSTEDETAIIESYTSGTTVTLDATIGDDWDGDTIYILGQEFTFGGDATDIYALESIGIKYNSTDDYYRQAKERTKSDLFQTGYEQSGEGAPIFYLTTVTVSGNLTSALGILPKFTTKVDKGIQINYVRKVSVLSGDSDTLRLPVDTPVIYGATMRAYEKKKELNNASYWSNKYEQAKRTSISRYRPLSTSRQNLINIPRRYGAMHKRFF